MSRATRPLAGVVTTAVSAVQGVRAVYLDVSGDLVVDIDPRDDSKRIAAQVCTILSVGLGCDALLVTDVAATLSHPEPVDSKPLADVIPLPRRADTWPGLVPAIPDLDVTVPWQPGPDRSQDRAIRIITRGHVGPDGRRGVDLTVVAEGTGHTDAVHRTVADVPEQIRAGLIDLAIRVAADEPMRVRCVDTALLDLAGRDALVVVVARDGRPDPGLAIRWVDTDSRVSWVMATLEAVRTLDRHITG